MCDKTTQWPSSRGLHEGFPSGEGHHSDRYSKKQQDLFDRRRSLLVDDDWHWTPDQTYDHPDTVCSAPLPRPLPPIPPPPSCARAVAGRVGEHALDDHTDTSHEHTHTHTHTHTHVSLFTCLVSSLPPLTTTSRLRKWIQRLTARVKTLLKVWRSHRAEPLLRTLLFAVARGLLSSRGEKISGHMYTRKIV